MNTNTQMLQTLAGSPMFLDYQRAFSEATGLPLSLRSAEDWHAAFHGTIKINPFCKLIAEQSRACAPCLQLQAKLCESATLESRTVACSYGMLETAVPVRLGNVTIGFLVTGQVFRKNPTEEDVRRVYSIFKNMGLRYDPEKVRTLILQTPVLPRQQLAAITRLLEIFAEHLAMKSNILVIRNSNSEPDAVVRVKQFVEAHYEEDITLSDAAQAARTSIYYLCKLLKKNLGMSFTEFLCRRRIEVAKQLLANPNLRVSEIAYQVGFQSLTHFNRIFRKLVGTSPTDFRSSSPLALAA